MLSDRANADYDIAALLHLLINKLQYTPEFPVELSDNSTKGDLSTGMLEGYDILVLGAPTKDLREDESLKMAGFCYSITLKC